MPEVTVPEEPAVPRPPFAPLVHAAIDVCPVPLAPPTLTSPWVPSPPSPLGTRPPLPPSPPSRLHTLRPRLTKTRAVPARLPAVRSAGLGRLGRRPGRGRSSSQRHDVVHPHGPLDDLDL